MHAEGNINALAEDLRSSVNEDGGWGYFQGKTSRIEPTCWAALALLDGRLAEDDGSLVNSALSLLGRWQRADGLLSELAEPLPILHATPSRQSHFSARLRRDLTTCDAIGTSSTRFWRDSWQSRGLGFRSRMLRGRTISCPPGPGPMGPSAGSSPRLGACLL